jgi:hypothetical protein
MRFVLSKFNKTILNIFLKIIDCSKKSKELCIYVFLQWFFSKSSLLLEDLFSFLEEGEERRCDGTGKRLEFTAVESDPEEGPLAFVRSLNILGHGGGLLALIARVGRVLHHIRPSNLTHFLFKLSHWSHCLESWDWTLRDSPFNSKLLKMIVFGGASPNAK